MIPVRPDQQSRLGGIENRFEQRGAESATARGGIHHELCLVASDDRDRELADGEQLALTATQFHEALVGERRLTVGDASPLDEPGNGIRN
jgi:hypothetical protein